jgi:hypothetical protein
MTVNLAEATQRGAEDEAGKQLNDPRQTEPETALQVVAKYLIPFIRVFRGFLEQRLLRFNFLRHEDAAPLPVVVIIRSLMPSLSGLENGGSSYGMGSMR